jgi:hypothetical protein
MTITFIMGFYSHSYFRSPIALEACMLVRGLLRVACWIPTAYAAFEVKESSSRTDKNR